MKILTCGLDEDDRKESNGRTLSGTDSHDTFESCALTISCCPFSARLTFICSLTAIANMCNILL